MGLRTRACLRTLSLFVLSLVCACGEVGFDRPGDAAADRNVSDGFVPRDAAPDRNIPGEDARVEMDSRVSDATLDADIADATPDADVPDAVPDAAVESCDDGVQNQGELFVDSGGPCSFRAPKCGEGIDPWTLGLFTFESVTATTVADEKNAGTGAIRSGPASYVASTTGCGMAWQGTSGVWLDVPNVPGWKQMTGSVDFWLRVPDMSAETTMQVPLSRDAQGSGDGHFIVAVTPEQRVVVRYQSTVSEVYRCSSVLGAGQWVHVGLNWGSPNLELYIDGDPGDFVGSYPFSNAGDIVNCNANAFTVGANANDEPWVIGANQWTSTPGTSDATIHYLKASAAVDHIRISSVRRDFTR